MGLYPCLHRELYQGRGQVENCRSQQRAHNKKEVKKCKQRSCNQFPLLLCWFLYSGNERIAEKGPPGALMESSRYSCSMYNWQIFYLLILIRGKMQQRYPINTTV